MWAGMLTVLLFGVTFGVELFRGEAVEAAATSAVKVVGLFTPVLAGLAVMGFRGAMTGMLLLCVVGGSVACNTAESYKVQNIYPSALTHFPPGATVAGSQVMEDGQVQYEIILPDGTYQTVIGPGNTGNFTVILNQNDGTEQSAKGQVEADISPNVGVGGGTASGGDKAKGDTVLEGDTSKPLPRLEPMAPVLEALEPDDG